MQKPLAGISGLLFAVFLATTAMTTATQAGIPVPRDGDGLPTLAPVLDQVTPAVVNIAVISRSPSQDNPLLRDPFFRRFFNIPERKQRPQVSAGSGVIVDAVNGFVVTNNHVIENAERIQVTLKDRRHFDAELVGTDPETDIALLRIKADGLTAVKLGDSDVLRVGDFVVAIGNPFGLGQTVTSGIVSALGRSGLNIEGYEDFIQTDASINPGNSGGALINLRGELVGVNTAIIGPSGGNVGIGFAVPANMTKTVVEQLVSFGEVRRGRLGISIQDLTPDLAEALGVKMTEGAVVTQVDPSSPAAKADIRPGDVIVELNSKEVGGATDLRNQLGLTPVGTRVTFGLYRDGKRETIITTVAATDEEAGGMADVPQLAGATVRDYQSGDLQGILVSEVQSGSPAWVHGLRPGDIVVGLNRQRVRSVSEFTQALQASGAVMALNILRGNARIFIVIR